MVVTPPDAKEKEKRFAVLLPIGPKEPFERLQDLIESLLHYEPAECDVVIVNDNNPEVRQWATQLRYPDRIRLHVVPNPRNGRGNGWAGGLACGVIYGFQWIQIHIRPAFTLRLDADSLICGPFADRILRAFETPAVGMLGSFEKYPDGTSRLPLGEVTDSLKYLLGKLASPFAVFRPAPRTLYWNQGIWGRGRRRAELIRRAYRNGLPQGWHIQGGGYAVSRAALDAMFTQGLIADPYLFLHAPFGEDVVLTICVYGAGFHR